MSRRFVAQGLGMAGWLVLGSLAAADGWGVKAFEPLREGIVEQAPEEAWVRRQRYALVDSALLFAGGDRAAAAEQVIFNLFEGLDLAAIRRENDLGIGDTPMWFGDLADEPHGYALFVEVGGAVSGKVYSPSRGTFEITSPAPGLVAIRELDLDVMPGCGVDHRHEVAMPGEHFNAEGGRRGVVDAPAERGAETGTFVFADVGLMYTAAARQAVGSTASMESLLTSSIADTNLAYQNSNITLRVRIAFMVETPYVQHGTDMGSDLSNFRAIGDGAMDDIHTLRDAHGADLCALIVNNATNACGIAYLMLSVGPGFASSAFSVTARTCLSGATLPHELGHNMGCAHDRDNAGSASWPYAYGYRAPGAVFRTIMAYAPGTRINHFSNPDVLFSGMPTGNPLNHPTNPTHNALAINNNSPTIIAWRNAYTAPPETFALLTPEDEAMTANRTPTFSWQPADQADYYHLQVDDDPAFGSPEINALPLSAASYAPSTTPPLALASGQTYYWRVWAVNPLGSTLSTPQSRSFTTPAAAPAAFSLISPAWGAVGVSRNPTFQWSQSVDSDGYALMVDDDPGFGSPAINATGLTSTSYIWLGPALNPLTQYYWTVSSTNNIGTTLSSPASSSFQTLGVAPGAFNLTSPPDGAFIDTTTPTLTWTAASFAESYRVILDNNLSLASPEVDVSGLTELSFQVPSGVLVNETRYYWQVRATNETGTTTSSPAVATFAVVVPPPNCPGDANGDNAVNFLDITTILVNWGGSGPQGDSNHDNQVNFLDITTSLVNWGAPCN